MSQERPASLRAPGAQILLRGAREHNLKNLDLDLPRDRLIVITGVSGSGKSSLAFDTLYAEGQRRYVESLSAYARQFLGQMEKPDVDRVEGLSPAIAIEQRTAGSNPRSTVATVTEIYDYLRLLFARVGRQHCPECGTAIQRQTVQEMVDRLLALPDGTRLSVFAPVVRRRKGEYRKEMTALHRQGFLRARVDGQLVELEQPPALNKQKWHTIEVLVDRIAVARDEARRLADSLETAARLTGGLAQVEVAGEKEPRMMAEQAACPKCGRSFPALEPRSFSFNSPFGACPACGGLGTHLDIDAARVVPDADLSLSEGAIEPWSKIMGGWYQSMLATVARHYRLRMDTPWRKLAAEHRRVILHGAGRQEFHFKVQSEKSRYEHHGRFEGVIPNLMRRYRDSDSDKVREFVRGYMSEQPCPECRGARLRPETLAVRIHGRNIAEFTRLAVESALAAVRSMAFEGREQLIAGPILKEVSQRLGFLVDVGLGYLTLDRPSGTLAGGESQRIRLATQIGSRLMGVLYILDEPSIGLHHRDNHKLLRTLLALRDLGNTVIVVEHDRDTMLAADHIVDLGPGAGRLGGEIVAQGAPTEVLRAPASLTGQYLSGKRRIEVPAARRAGSGRVLRVVGAAENNLKRLTADIPLGKLVVVTGVSGSGKSTLINDVLFNSLAHHFYAAQVTPGAHDRIEGLELIDKVVDVDQSPIGRTPRSNAATYTGTFGPIRDLFALLPESKARGYAPGRFSFNVKGGRCEACEGDGVKKIEMHFLPDVYVRCDVCRGRRYNRETLEVLYKGRSIADVLEMTVEEAMEFLRPIPPIHRKLRTLYEVGLGYLHLGQAATTLSGGEAQRVKLATELSRVSTGRTLYLLDEPTTGLHFEDVKMLLAVLHQLVDKGNTVVVIEHQLDVIKSADWILDLGPEGGDAGGTLVAQGTPEEVARVKGSHTGAALKEVL
ncbi:MAG TPA: excinuclease ABC subunit UvrA [Candidatus Saccharimonadales bacterium]|nr:excinuclease ABC subunit UvrA [Candidatus Saccharimonadales bacterium]